MIERSMRVAEPGLHRASAGANLLWLLAVVGVVLGSNGVALKAACFVLVTMLAAFSGIGPAQFLRRMRFVLVFTLVLFIAQALSVQTGAALLRNPIRLTDQGVLAGAAMAFRFLTVISASLLFVLVTDPDQLAQTLIRWGIPYRFGYVLILALRFVPFFEAEVRTIREAQRMRGIQTRVRTPRDIARAVRYTFVPVLVSALSRVDGIAISMKGRCFGLHSRRTFSRPLGWRTLDWFVLILCVLLVLSTVASRLWEWF